MSGSCDVAVASGAFGLRPWLSPLSEVAVTSACGRQAPKRVVVVSWVGSSSSERVMSGGRPVTSVEMAVTDSSR